MSHHADMTQGLSDSDYRLLATFRSELRQFLKFSEEAAAEAGITGTQHQALLAIRASASETMLVGELSEALLLRPHSTSELIDRLSRLRLVERNRSPHDRREVRILLTSAGEALLKSLAAAHRDELRRMRPLLTHLLEDL